MISSDKQIVLKLSASQSAPTVPNLPYQIKFVNNTRVVVMV